MMIRYLDPLGVPEDSRSLHSETQDPNVLKGLGFRLYTPGTQKLNPKKKGQTKSEP